MINTVQINDDCFTACTSWDQLSEKAFSQVAPYLIKLQLAAGTADEEQASIQAKLILARAALDVPWKTWLQLNQEQHLALCPAADPFLQRIQFRGIRISKLGKFTAPAPGFRNTSIHEFIIADSYFMLFQAKRKTDALYYLAATQYRPATRKASTGDTREPFNEHTIAQRAAYFEKHFKLNDMFAIALQYQANRAWLAKQFPLCFPAGKSSKKAPKPEQLILDKAGGKFGTYEDTKKTPVMPFFQDAEEEIKRHKEQLRNLKKKRHA